MLYDALYSWRKMNPDALSCCKKNGKPALVALFYLHQDGKVKRIARFRSVRL